MFVKYKVNLSTYNSPTATTINIPINLEYQIVDNAELIETKFVDYEINKSVNPILDYEKVRFIPLNNANSQLKTITYNLSLLGPSNTLIQPTYYSNIGFVNDDIKFERNVFKKSYLRLQFYDTDNALTQNLFTEIDIYSMLLNEDYYPFFSAGTNTQPPIIAGTPRPASQIPVRFRVSDPLTMFGANTFYEGYYIYNYKDEFTIGAPKNLYMKGTYFNGKTGTVTNLTTSPIGLKIDKFVNSLYTKYTLFRDTTGFYYNLENTYSNNIAYSTGQNNTNVTVNLYQVQAL
jgi:hypothetical protein